MIFRAATIHRCTTIFFVTIRISIFEWDIAVSQNNKIFLIKNEKLLYQHSEITVLISFMTPYPSTGLFLATGLRRCLVSLRMLPVTYFSRWRHESMRSFNKLSADTVLCARNKNTRFVRHGVVSFVKMSSSAVELKLTLSSYKSKVWKDFGFKVFLRWPRSKTHRYILVLFLPFVNCYQWKLKIPKQFSNITSLVSCML